MAPPAVMGHFDELRKVVSAQPASGTPLAAPWARFFDYLPPDFAGLNQRNADLQRQIQDNGVTYNVYADASGPQRPWSLDLFPLLVSASDWEKIESGICQRAQLLDRIMADIYGEQQLLTQGLLPSALVHGHPGYLRAMHGVKPAGGTYLHIAAFDLAHGPDGHWSVVSQRTQAPSGLGYLLENRLTISMLFPQAFHGMDVQRLAGSYKALVDGLKAMSPQHFASRAEASGAMDNSHLHNRSEASRVVLLTSGPYNETYFEHASLARYLGLTLVEGNDLLVRDEKLFLKTLRGLEPVHGLLKRLDDEFLDPLEMRADSTLGVPGLLQVIRAGNVLVVNMPGSCFLESTALLGFLPALSRHLLGERLALPSLATWWCGEKAAMQEALGQLKKCVIKPTYPGSHMQSVIGQTLSPRELDEWAGRIARRGENYTVQAYQPLSQTPTWQQGRIAPRSAMLRVFAVADGHGRWKVLPGGLARLAGKNQHIASMQHGGSSADVWVLKAKDKAVAEPSPVDAGQAAASVKAEQALAGWATAPLRQRPPVTSRSAENLFWLGRYTERAENATRLAQLTLRSLGGDSPASPALLEWLTQMAVGNSLVLSSVPPATQSRRVFERALIASLADTSQAASVGYTVRALKNAASAVRDRLSQEQWHMIVRAEADFFQRCTGVYSSETGLGLSTSNHAIGNGKTKELSLSSAPTASGLNDSPIEALKTLDSLSGFLVAITGAQKDRMTRDDGWRLLSAGRLIERLGILSEALVRGFECKALLEESGFDAMLALFDSTITFHAQYQERLDIPALLDILVLDSENPRALACVICTLRERLALLSGTQPGQVTALAVGLPDPVNWQFSEILPGHFGVPDSSLGNRFASVPLTSSEGDFEKQTDPDFKALVALLQQCGNASHNLSDALGRRFFSHTIASQQNLSA